MEKEKFYKFFFLLEKKNHSFNIIIVINKSKSEHFNFFVYKKQKLLFHK